MIYFKMTSYTEPFKEMNIEYPVSFGTTLDLEGEVMYENTHFTDKTKAIECQKSNLLAGIESCNQIIQEAQKTIDQFESQKDRYYVYYTKIVRDKIYEK